MERVRTFSLSFLFGLASMCVSMGGCTTTSSVQVMQPIEENLSRYKRAFVVVTAAPEIQSQPLFEYTQTRLKSAMTEKLKASRTFQEILDKPPANPTDSDLKIVATITSLGTESRPYAAPSAGVDVGIGTGGGGFGAVFGLGLGTILPAPRPGLMTNVEILTAQTERRLGYIDAHARTGDLGAQADAVADKVVTEITTKSR
ncbi:MAG: hypothetical protein ACREQK_10055 [Candidatus Binatia bacterium]